MSNIVKVNMINDIPMIDIYLWDKKKSVYRNMLVVLDTGASVTTLSKDILFALGYDVDAKLKSRITTASGVEYVSEVIAEKIKIGNIEFPNVKIYGHTFPQESFSIGVIGMNILKCFDIHLLFSKNEIVFESIKDSI